MDLLRGSLTVLLILLSGHATEEGTLTTEPTTAKPCKKHKKKSKEGGHGDSKPDLMEPQLLSVHKKKRKKWKKHEADGKASAEGQRISLSGQDSVNKTQSLDKLAGLELVEVPAPGGDVTPINKNPEKKRKKRKSMLVTGYEEVSPTQAKKKKMKDPPVEEMPYAKLDSKAENPSKSKVKKKKDMDTTQSTSEEAMNGDTANQDAHGFEGLSDNSSDGAKGSVKKRKKCKKNKNKSGYIDKVEDGIGNIGSSEKKGKHKTGDYVKTDASLSGAEPVQNVDSEKKQTRKKHKKEKKETDQYLPIINIAVANGSISGESHSAAAKKQKGKIKKVEKNKPKTQEQCKVLDEEVNPMKMDKKKRLKGDKGRKEPKRGSNKKVKSDLSSSNSDPTANNQSHMVNKLDSVKTVQNNSSPTQAVQASTTSIGQWTSNMFESSERQNKFLRLLGSYKKSGEDSASCAVNAGSGRKKGLFGSLQLKQDACSGGQRALTYQGAQELNKQLESDYERALTFSVRGQRGVGLGFTPDPAAGKRFHIDINKTASKKFDD